MIYHQVRQTALGSIYRLNFQLGTYQKSLGL